MNSMNLSSQKEGRSGYIRALGHRCPPPTMVWSLAAQRVKVENPGMINYGWSMIIYAIPQNNMNVVVSFFFFLGPQNFLYVCICLDDFRCIFGELSFAGVGHRISVGFVQYHAISEVNCR